MKSKFNVYDPMVQQALIAQGSQFLVPPSPQIGVPPALDPGGGPSMLQQIGMMNAPAPQEMAITSTDGASTYMAPRFDPMAFSGDTAGYLTEQDVLPLKPASPLARVQAPSVQAPQQPPAQQPKPSRAPTQARPSQSMQGRDAAFESLLEGYDNRARIAADAGAARADTADQRARMIERSTVDDMLAQQELADAADAHQGATAKVQQEQRADAEFIRSYVPSDRRTTSQRVMGAIAVALSGIADGMMAGAGGQGYAMERTLGIINTSIDRDIDLQQRMLDNKKTALAAKNTELGQMRERYGDSVEAIKLARVMKIDQYQKELDAVIAGGATQDAAFAAKDTQAQLKMQSDQLEFEVYGSRFQQELRARQGMGASQRLSLEGKALDNEKKRQELAAGPAGDKSTKEKIRSREEVLDLIGRIQKTRADNPIERGLPEWTPFASAPAELSALNADLMTKAKEAKEMGSLDAGTERVLYQLLGDPATWGRDADTKLNAYKKTTEREKAALQGPEAQRALDARGRTRPGAAR